MWRLMLALALLPACGASVSEERPSSSRPVQPKLRAPEVQLFFKGEQPFARRGDEEWPLKDVRKSEMVFAPSGKQFAYVRARATASLDPSGPAQPAHVIVRNLAGDPVNEFPLYRATTPDELIWLDNHRLGYLSPPAEAAPGKRPAPVYVVHDIHTGEVLAARSGVEFVWGPARRHVAFVSGAPLKQQVVVDGQTVWPRAGSTRVHGGVVWSNDGRGLAFAEETKEGPRLVVLVDFDDAGGDLTWPIPREATAPGLKVYWAGDSKVVIGESALSPKFAADWQRIK
jgi:hypothetical protein